MCFPSGLRAHLIQRPGTGLVGISMVIDGGRAAEKPEERGAAHLAEHLWFRSRPHGKSTVEDMGAGLDSGATTRSDVTAYTTIGPAADLAALLALEAKRLEEPLLGVTPAALRAEKRIVKDELLYRGEHGARLAQARIDDLLFPEGHPYRGTTAVRDDVDRLEIPQLTAYIDRTYVPEGTTVSIEADLALDTVQEAFTTAFGDALAGSGTACDHPRSKEEPPPAPGASTFTTVEAPIRTQRVYMAWSLPAAWGPDGFVHDLSSHQLESAIWSRLPWVSGLKDDRRDVKAGCSYVPGRVASRLLCVVELPPSVHAEKLTRAAMNSLNSQWGISADDQRSRTLLTQALQSSMLNRTLASADQMDIYAVEERAIDRHVLGGGDTLKSTIDATLALNPNHLAAVAEAYLTPERAVVLHLKPTEYDGPATTGQAPKARLSVDTLPSWTSPRPKIEMETNRLANGLTVVTSYQGSAPATRTALVRRGGSLVAKLGTDIAWDASAVYYVPGVSLSDMRAKTGAVAWDANGWNHSTVHARAGGGSSDLAMWATRVWLDTTTVDTQILQRALDRELEALERDLTTWPTMQTYTFRAEHLMREDPAAKPWWDEWGAARGIRDTEILKWRKLLNNPRRSTLLMVSPDPVDSLTQATRYLAKWKGKDLDHPGTPAPPAMPTSRKVMSINWNSLMTDVRLSCRVAPRTLENDAAQDVLVEVLDRGAWQTLREDGGSYAPEVSFYAPHSGVALIGFHAQVQPSQAGGTVSALFELLAMVKAGAPDSVLRWGQLEALGIHARRHASTLDHFYALNEVLTTGLPLDSVNTYPERVDAVTSADLTALLETCVGFEAVTVVGPTPSVNLAEAGLSPVPVDWQSEGVLRARAVQ